MPFNFKGDGKQMNNGFLLMPEGDYRLKCSEAVESESKSGKPMIRMILNPIDPQYAQKKLFFYLVLLNEDEDGHGLTLHALKQFGQEWEGDVKVDAENFINMTVDAHVVQDEYQGKKNNKIAYLLSTREDDPSEDDIPL